jgi:hypothetical protein
MSDMIVQRAGGMPRDDEEEEEGEGEEDQEMGMGDKNRLNLSLPSSTHKSTGKGRFANRYKYQVRTWLYFLLNYLVEMQHPYGLKVSFFSSSLQSFLSPSL